MSVLIHGVAFKCEYPVQSVIEQREVALPQRHDCLGCIGPPTRPFHVGALGPAAMFENPAAGGLVIPALHRSPDQTIKGIDYVRNRPGLQKQRIGLWPVPQRQ